MRRLPPTAVLEASADGGVLLFDTTDVHGDGRGEWIAADVYGDGRSESIGAHVYGDGRSVPVTPVRGDPVPSADQTKGRDTSMMRRRQSSTAAPVAIPVRLDGCGVPRARW